MKKLYLLVVGIVSLSSLNSSLNAQCTGIRYRDFMFTDSVKSDVVYGNNLRYDGVEVDTLKLDLHFPKSDPAPQNRPLMIIAHGGNFLLGDKAGLDVLPMAGDFAKMGYVVASINYRVGMDGYPSVPLDSLIATRAMMRAVQDAHAAVRFFRKSAATGNPYGIDTSNIFFTGVASGGFLATGLAYLNQISEFPAWCDTTKPGLSGGIAGASGNPGYPSNVKAVVNICGGISDTSWIKPGSTPVCSFHGDQDSTVPYQTGHFNVTRIPLQTVQGSYSIMLRANHIGLTNCFDQWVGQPDVPEVSSFQYYDTCRNITRNFLVHFICGDPLFCEYEDPMGVKEFGQVNASLHCYPNPTDNMLTIDLSELYGEDVSLILYNNMGQEVRKYDGIRNAQFILSRGDLPNGIYLLNATVKGKRFISKLIFN